MILDLLQISLRDPTVYDEMSADGVNPRPHWTHFLELFGKLGPDELAKRWMHAERRIRENGVTYNVYGDPLGANRPWKIDLIPLLIPAGEWRSIETGIIQRARLLELLVNDLYGPQELLIEGRVPAPLLFANPAFLRPLVGLPVPRYLHIVAVDLARSPDGRWWVLADRTQAPSGVGYAVENRTIIGDALPEMLRASNISQLSPFFSAERESLTKLAGCDHPRIVVLTPGPYNETYFEHSYLARHLGFTLVQGGDLAVRDRRVYVKTVHGLEPVHVILRRVDDDFCDPLELRGDSYLGVAGLVDAVSAGNVRIANALGTGLIETAALMPFLPGLARHLLGETLKLPSVATWWCGQDYALDWVLDHLPRIVIKPAFPSTGMEPVFGADLTTSSKERFLDKLRSRPYEYVAQEQVALSTAPVWDGERLSSRSIVLRAYALNTGDDWIVLPGGLVRLAESGGSVVSMQRGGYSKDAWVMGESPMDTFGIMPPRNPPLELHRGSADLPSRAADNLFWLGRYAERSENIARILRTIVTRMVSATDLEVRCLCRLHSCLESRHSKLSRNKQPTMFEIEQEVVSLMGDRRRPDSLVSNLGEVFRVGGAVRERLSSDMIRLLRELTESAQVEDYMLFAEYSALLSGSLELLSAFSGLERENVTRGVGWLFMSLGRRLERAIYMARLLREITLPLSEGEWPLLEFLLEVADSSMTYRSRYYTTLQPAAVLDVLMADETNPRSLMFQLSHLADLYNKLPRHSADDAQAMNQALDLLRGFDLQAIGTLAGLTEIQQSSGEIARLERFLDKLGTLLQSWSNNLSNVYFSHARTLPISIGE